AQSVNHLSERDLVVEVTGSPATAAAPAESAASATAAARGTIAVSRARLAKVGAATAAIADLAALALAAGVEHLQLAAELLQHDLGRVAVLAVLVLPLAGLQLAL